MERRRRVRAVLGGLLGLIMVVGWAWGAQAQTTTPTTSTTVKPSTTTTHAATTTSRPTPGSTTTTRPVVPVRLAFQATPTEGPPGTTVTVQSINECRGSGSFYVLLSIGPYRLGSGAADRVGNWKFDVTVPQVPPGTYGLAATCLISRNGVDENAGIYTGPQFTVRPGQGPPEPTTPAANKGSGDDNTALLIGLIAAIVVALGALVWALSLRAKHRRETGGAGMAGAGGGTAPRA